MSQSFQRPPSLRFPRGMLLLAAVGWTALPGIGAAQTVEDPVLPRGSILLEVRSAHTQASRAFGDRLSTGRFGDALLDAPLTPATFPALATEETRFRELLQDPGASLAMGRLYGRFHANEQHTPIRIGWGATDRITAGLTVPLVRRQVSATLGVSPEDGNVGANPAQGPDAADVQLFRTEAATALADLQATVAEVCAEEGQDSPACVEGVAAAERVSGLLAQLEAAWDEALLFPLRGSPAGTVVADRWTEARTDLDAWGAGGPESVPLSSRPLSPSTFATRFVHPVWGTAGFPLETPERIAAIGDIQLHLVIGLAQGDAASASRIRFRSAVEVSARLPTGTPDSMALVASLEPPRGYGGGGIRWISDLAVDERVAILSEVEWETLLSRDLVLLGMDPDDPWSPADARRQVEGGPGDRFRLRISPRFVITPGLSFGAGWEWYRGGEGRWITTDPGAPREAVQGPVQGQRASLEFRFAGWDERFRESLPFPIETMGRASLAFSGNAAAPRDRRLELGVRVLRGGR